MMLTDRMFQIGNIAEIAGVEPAALRTWINRGMISTPSKDRSGGGGPGRPLKLSGRVLIQVVLASMMVRQSNVEAVAAFLATEVFAHLGQEELVFHKGKPIDLWREAGFPFHTSYGDTYLFYSGGRTATALACTTQGEASSLLGEIDGAPVGAYSAVNATRAFDHVCRTLSIHPEEQLGLAYKGKVQQ